MNYERQTDFTEARQGAPTMVDPAAPRSRRRAIIAVILIAVAVLGAWYAFGTAGGGGGTDAAATARAVPTVTVMVPGRQTVERTISANGTIAARREMPVGIAGEGGQVARVLVEPGQWVGAGQVLATIERSVQAQQIASLAAQIRVAQADASLAQSELDRAQALIGRGFISKADLDRRTATRDAANARVRVAQAQLGEARARTGRLDIRAPAAGLVLTRQVEPGQVVGAGSGVLFRIARGGEMELLAQLAEADLQQLAVGTRATVTPVGTDLNIPGQVWQIAPVIDPTSRQGTARIAVPYSDALRPGGFADARLVAGTGELPLLPESAVLSGADGNYVLVVDPADTVQRVPVKVGAVTDDGVSIASGLVGTERVVTVAGAFLNVGDKVKPTVLRPAAAR